MLKRINDVLAGVWMTLVSGVFLAASLALQLTGTALPIDPAWGSAVISGLPLVYLALWRVVHNPGISKISSALLISVAMIAAIAIGDIFAAGEVAFIMAIGAILEEKTTERAQRGLKALISLSPQQGRRLRDGKEELVPVSQIEKGDLLRVLPDETIPVDGVVVSGSSSVDQAVLTGESLPADKEAGDPVFCGTINRFGAMELRAEKVGEDASLQKLIRMVREAEENKAPMQRLADRWASWLVPAALLIAVAAYFATGELVRAVTVLVVFCPCALVLATPTAIMAAIGQATKHGVIIKSGEALERMGKADVVAFDKTGTLTYGRLQVTDLLPLRRGLSPEELLALTAGVESRSEHPLGKAIAAHAREAGTALPEIEAFEMESGRGVAATAAGRRILCGSDAFLKSRGVSLSGEAEEALKRLRGEGKAVVLTADESGCLGAIALSDTLRPGVREMTRRLSSMDVQTLLLTGDSREAAEFLLRDAGIDRIDAQLLPQQKVEHIDRLQKAGRSVCMVGDGVNDAPALKTADVGVAKGSMGSDIAVEAADVALMSDDLSKLPYLKRLSNAAVNTIRLSITLSLCINFVAIGLSLAGILTPTTGALVHNAGSVFVVLIAALLYDRKLT